MKQLLLSDREAIALEKALEIYIKLGLGKISSVIDVVSDTTSKRQIQLEDMKDIGWNLLDAERALNSDQWNLEDQETDSLTIAAFGIQAKLGDNHGAWEWACKRLHENNDLD